MGQPRKKGPKQPGGSRSRGRKGGDKKAQPGKVTGCNPQSGFAIRPACSADPPLPDKTPIKPASAETCSPLLKEADEVPGRLNITKLPAEVLCHVGSFLTPAERAALALTCKEVVYKVGSRELCVAKKDRYELFGLLEKDLTTVLARCKGCNVLHSAFNHTSPKCRGVSTTLPEQIQPRALRTVMRWYNKGMDYNELCSKLERFSWASHGASHEQVRLCRRAPGGSSSSSAAAAAAPRLVLRQQMAFKPAHVRTLSRRDMYRMLANAGSDTMSQAARFCLHKRDDPARWGLRPSRAPLGPDTAGCRRERASYAGHRHDESCYTDTAITGALGDHDACGGGGGQLECFARHAQPCADGCVPLLNEIRGCTRCHTDFAVGVACLPGGRRCLVLTSWKDLGAWRDGQEGNACFLSHGQSNTGGKVVRSSVGDIYRAFEGVGDAGGTVYVPELPRRLRDMVCE